MSRILVVDDDPLLLRAYSRALSRAHLEVVTARNGLLALEEHRRQPVDLVVADILMPEMEGLELIMELRKLEPFPPVIAVSGSGRDPQLYLRTAAKLGAVATLQKPIGPQELIDAVLAHLP